MLFAWVVFSHPNKKTRTSSCDWLFRNLGFTNPEALGETLSNEKRAPGWLGCIGDEKLPSYKGIIINHYKDWKVRGFSSWLN